MTYAQNVTDAKKFLGEIIQPEDISMSILERIDQTCARRLANSDLAAIVLGLLREHSAISVADAWAAAIQIMYLGASLLLSYVLTVFFISLEASNIIDDLSVISTICYSVSTAICDLQL